MKYILQSRQGNTPEWLDLLISEDEKEMEEEFKKKSREIAIDRLRIVKTVTSNITVSIHILD
jgi:hypothetical protein